MPKKCRVDILGKNKQNKDLEKNHDLLTEFHPVSKSKLLGPIPIALVIGTENIRNKISSNERVTKT